MAYPSSQHLPNSGGPLGPELLPASHGVSLRRAASAQAQGGCRRAADVQGGDTPRDHQLEKLEFALAVALTRGDNARSLALRQQIAALGGNCEEPGT